MADRDGLKCNACGGNDADMPCAYPSGNANGCLRDKRLASPQPAPHAMTDERILEISALHSDDVNSCFIFNREGDHSVLSFARALLAQTAAVEPAKVIGYVSSKQLEVLKPEGQYLPVRRVRGGNFDTPIYSSAPSPAVAEPARKAIDAQGAEDLVKLFKEVMDCYVRQLGLHAHTFEMPDELFERVKLFAERENRNSGYGSPLPAATLVKAEHPDDAAVDAFAAELKSKLAKSREKGRGGWQECDPADLSRMLREHVEKGDPRDVANFCMFLWHLNAPIAQQPAASDVRDGAENRWLDQLEILVDMYEDCDKPEELRTYVYGSFGSQMKEIKQLLELNRAQSTPAVQADEGKIDGK